MKLTRLTLLLGLISIAMWQCHAIKWHQNYSDSNFSAPPPAIAEIFAAYPNKIMEITAATPGYSYPYDIAEKDSLYGHEDQRFHFKTVQITLHETMPSSAVIVDLKFIDDADNAVIIPEVDLMRLTPKIDSEEALHSAELLLEEFNRFGLNFRKEHGEFAVETTTTSTTLEEKAYRVAVVNNCLDPTKWEFTITTEHYDNFKNRVAADININQNRLLAHSWFYLDKALYAALVQKKNPSLDMKLLTTAYNDLSDMAESKIVDFEKLRRPIKHIDNTKLLEIGHQSNRIVEPVDIEEYFKREFGLLINNNNYTYKSILDQPIHLTQFLDRGYYTEKTPKICDFNWMQYADNIEVAIIDQQNAETYAQLKISGEWSPYEITIGNVDLALIDEQRLFGLLFGVNTYPKSRRYNPLQNTIAYDAELLPNDLKPFVLLTDKKTGKWVNNQYKGIEKIYLTYDNLEQDILTVYVLSYERITPVWMGRVKLSKRLREKIRVRRNIYNY